jgi:hypothetical protein
VNIAVGLQSEGRAEKEREGERERETEREREREKREQEPGAQAKGKRRTWGPEQRGSKGPGNQGGTPQCGTVWCCGAPCDGSGLALKWNWTLDGRVYASETRRYSRSEEGSGGMLRLKGKGQEDPPKN